MREADTNSDGIFAIVVRPNRGAYTLLVVSNTLVDGLGFPFDERVEFQECLLLNVTRYFDHAVDLRVVEVSQERVDWRGRAEMSYKTERSSAVRSDGTAPDKGDQISYETAVKGGGWSNVARR